MDLRVCIITNREEIICRPEVCENLIVTIHQLSEVFIKIIKNKDVFTKNH